MKEKCYEVFLTKSHRVAWLIQDAHRSTDGIINTRSGIADDSEMVPPIYYGQGYYCCVITRESDGPGYELIIA